MRISDWSSDVCSSDLGVHAWREVALLGTRLAFLDRPPFVQPLRQAAVEHGDLLVPEGAEGPPYARRAEDAALVVDHQPQAVAEAEPAHLRGEDVRRRHHGRPLPARVLAGEIGRAAVGEKGWK